MQHATPVGLYIHIPWCHTRCIYCDFNTYIDGTSALHAHYHQALLREIRETGAALNRPTLDTIFFGGGTPTTLKPQELVELVDAVKAAFVLCPDAEVTTEANPGTLSVEYLREIRQGGINRLSMGVQSFDDNELRFLSRLHNADTARRAVDIARQAGFDNINLDLIFNLPDQTLAAWQYNIQEALKLAPEHFSFYSLIVEPNTPLYKQVLNGEVPSLDDDVAADMYAYTIEAMDKAGYTHYEISNWAKHRGEADYQTPALAAQHNLIYWRNQPYLGLGAGAYGTFDQQRAANVKRPQRYIALIEAGGGFGAAHDPKTKEAVARDAALLEAVMMGLRLIREGISPRQLSERYDVDFEKHYAAAIEHGFARGLLEWVDTPTDRRLRLTFQGRFIANEAILAFFPDPEL